MRKVKFHKGYSEVFDVNAETFKVITNETYPYKQISKKDGKISAYGICPMCDNTVTLLGIYRPIKNERSDSYARHAKEDIPGFDKFNEDDYLYCPYHRRRANYVIEVRRKDITEEDIKILNIARENFDRCIYLIKKATGLVISNKLAMEIVKNYMANCGYMVHDRTDKNIPWIMLNKMPVIKLINRLVVKNSPLYEMLNKDSQVRLKAENKDYYRILPKNEKEYCALSLVIGEYSFLVDQRDNLNEYINLIITKPKNGLYSEYKRKNIQLDVYSFNNMVHSQKETYRNKELLKIAEDIIKIRP